MNPFRTLGREALLKALSEYHNKYRDILEFGGSEEQFDSCKLSLDTILNELSYRKTEPRSIPSSEGLRG